jgi:hypothetical protein
VVSFRVSPTLRERLEQRATANYRNLSQEVIRALLRSFDPHMLRADAAALERAQRDAQQAGERG